MKLRSDVLAALAVSAGIGLAMQADADSSRVMAPTSADSHAEVSLATDVMPLMEKYCWECHSEESAELGLKLDSYEGIMGGSDYGTVVEVGDADGSLLVDMIASGDMPEDGDPMAADELAIIKSWITEGANNN